MTRIHLDPADFHELISQAVDAAVQRLSAERHRDEFGNILVDKKQAAELLATSEATIDRWRDKHGLPAIKLDNGKVWFRPEALKEWAAAREVTND